MSGTFQSRKIGGMVISGPSAGGLLVKTSEGKRVLRANARTAVTTVNCLEYGEIIPETPESVAVLTDALRIVNVEDTTKKIKYNLSAVSSNTTRTLFMPDNDVLLGSGSGGGGVTAPSTTTINALVRWSDTSGIGIKDSPDIVMDDNGEITFTNAVTATKGIVFPDALADSFHFKGSDGNILLVFDTVNDIPKFPNSLELDHATDNNIVFPDNQAIGLKIKTSVVSYIQCKSTTSQEEVQILQDAVFTQGVKYGVSTISMDTTLTKQHYFIRGDTSGGNVTITLPVSSLHSGRQYKIVKMAAANTLFIDPNASEIINGLSVTLALSKLYDHITLLCDGVVGWFTL